eukprot:m51a1_g5635 hypothetical protein (428) ;mRNA; r:830269-831788
MSCEGPKLQQWASRVIAFSSSYERGWEADTLLGPPRVYPNYGDVRGSWAPLKQRGDMEFLELGYETPVFVTGIEIYETYNPGHVVRISVRPDENHPWVALYQSEVHVAPQQSRVWMPELLPCWTIAARDVRIDLDCTCARSWVEIDCVSLTGVRNAEWSPKLHPALPPSFRRAAHELALVNHRLGVFPQNVLGDILTSAMHEWPLQTDDMSLPPLPPPDPLTMFCGRMRGDIYHCRGVSRGCYGGTVWGTDLYTSDSSRCRAAVHAGVIGLDGGNFRCTMLSGRGEFHGSERNGVISEDYGAFSSSFTVHHVGSPQEVSDFRPCRPLGFGRFFCRGMGAGCEGGTVWGSGVYTSDSNRCSAAVHAGVIPAAEGGVFTCKELPAQNAYYGSLNNGVTTRSYGVWGSAFYVEGSDYEALQPAALPYATP